MRSLRELTDELVGVRLDATNVSLWNTAVKVREAARVALNQALRTYEFTVTRTYSSLSLPDTGTAVHVLPNDIDRVVDVHKAGHSGGDPNRLLRSWRHRRTAETNLLYLEAETRAGAVNVELLYEARLTELPPEVVIADSTLNTAIESVEVSGGNPAAQWRSPGYFEITPFQVGVTWAETQQREVVRYQAVLPGKFTGLQRNRGGVRTHAVAWTQGDLISPLVEAPDQGFAALVAGAEAAMYHYWVRHRALYEEYTGIASEQQLDLGDLLGLVRAEEDRADRIYGKTKASPEPGFVQTKRRRH